MKITVDIPDTAADLFKHDPDIGRRGLVSAGFSHYDSTIYTWAWKNREGSWQGEETEKGVIVPDIQYPNHNAKCLDVLGEFIEDYQPNYLIYIGDQLEMETLSSWRKKRFVPSEGTIKDELEGFDKEVLQLHESLCPDAKRVWFDGNHEYRADLYIESHKEFTGLIEPRNVLRLKERGYVLVEFNKIWKFGKCRLFHGFYWNKHHAMKTVDDIMHSCVYGHDHTLQAFTKMSPVDSREYYMAVSLPCLGDINPDYRKNKPNRYVNGFGVIEKFCDGSFNVYPVVINNGKFAWNGRVYS